MMDAITVADIVTGTVAAAMALSRERGSSAVIRGRRKPRAAAAAFSLHGAVYNTFNLQRHLISRPMLRRYRAAAFDAWETAAAAA